MSNNIGLPMDWEEFIDKGRKFGIFLLDVAETGKLPLFIEANLEPRNLNTWKGFLGLPKETDLLQTRNHITGIVGGTQIDSDEKSFKFKFFPKNLFRNASS